MDHSTQTITVNKAEIEDWLRNLTAELEHIGVQNEELTNAVETIQAAVRAPSPSGLIIKTAIEAIKSTFYGVFSSAAYNYLMEHPPI
jgi:hypothetical protein